MFIGFSTLKLHLELNALKADSYHGSIHKRILVVHPGGVLPYMGYIGMCRCEAYGFQGVYSSIGYINLSFRVQNRVSFLGN